jgi:hypothetical protein
MKCRAKGEEAEKLFEHVAENASAISALQGRCKCGYPEGTSNIST